MVLWNRQDWWVAKFSDNHHLWKYTCMMQITDLRIFDLRIWRGEICQHINSTILGCNSKNGNNAFRPNLEESGGEIGGKLHKAWMLRHGGTGLYYDIKKWKMYEYSHYIPMWKWKIRSFSNNKKWKKLLILLNYWLWENYWRQIGWHKANHPLGLVLVQRDVALCKSWNTDLRQNHCVKK